MAPTHGGLSIRCKRKIMMTCEEWNFEDEKRLRLHEIQLLESYGVRLLMADELGDIWEVPKVIRGTPVESLILRLRALSLELVEATSEMSRRETESCELEA
jgi:hypothetical protein